MSRDIFLAHNASYFVGLLAMHPLKQYLLDVDERIQDFAARVGVSRQTLYRIIAGIQAPKPVLARRIVEATGASVTLNMLYGANVPSSADIVGLNTDANAPLLDVERLKVAIAVVINHMRSPDLAPVAAETLDVAAEAIINTYVALAKVTSRRGPARLEQALRPVLEEILEETGGSAGAAALDRGAELAAQLYVQTP